MQQSLFIASSFQPLKREPIQSFNRELISKADLYNLRLEESTYTRWYCLKEILYEQYLWDMRCWDKPKYQYSQAEVMEHIKTWVKDHEDGNQSNNCGHCLYCIRKLLMTRTATLEEIADYCLRNNFIKYSDQIKSWNNGFEESLEYIRETSDCQIS